MSIVKESVSLRPESPAPTTTASGAPIVTSGAPALTPWPLVCKLRHAAAPAGPLAICEHCLGPLEPVAPTGRALPNRETIAARAPSLWRYREWLPFTASAPGSTDTRRPGDAFTAPLSPDTGFTPLVDAPRLARRLARRLGVARCWIKNDAVSHPSLSFKDRVVTAAHPFGLGTIGCASTGNLANAVAAHAAARGPVAPYWPSQHPRRSATPPSQAWWPASSAHPSGHMRIEIPFVNDGNRRVALLAANILVGLNGYELEAAEPEVVTAIESVAAGRISEASLATWVRNRLRPIADSEAEGRPRSGRW